MRSHTVLNVLLGRRRKWMRSRILHLGVIVALLVSGVQASAHASPASPDIQLTVKPSAPEQMTSVPGQAVPVKPKPADPAARSAAIEALPTWPAAGVAEIDIPSTGRTLGWAGQRVRAGSLPVWASASTSSPEGPETPRKVRVEVLDRATSSSMGFDGLLLRVARADGEASAGEVSVEIDTTAVADAYGGDWASRLKVFVLPECALTRSQDPTCQRASPLVSRNNASARRLNADVTIPGSTEDTQGMSGSRTGSALLAVAAAPDGAAGDYKATSLSLAGSWTAGGSSGDFNYSVPLRVPPTVAGPSPSLSLNYSSGSVDGRVASRNSQPSWIGDGWEFQPGGYIERSYNSCADDVSTTPKTGDQCWASWNATMNLGGSNVELVRDDTTGVWRSTSDDGSKIERITGGVNGDNDGEHWKVTTTDGTQYFFGRNRLPGWVSGKPETKSTWTVPVFGDDAGEPCNTTTFAASWCQQAWRWNLDHVVDVHGNAMTLYYEQEMNHYGRNLTTTATPYVRSGYLTKIDYGLRSGAELTSTAPTSVVFSVSERCIPSGSITCAESQLTSSTNKAYWPDVPFDQNCNAATACTGKYSPTFWSRKRLTAVTTKVLKAGAYSDVDSWTLRHTFPPSGDITSPALWLEGLTQTGHVNGTASLPEIDFDGVQMENRVDALEGWPKIMRYRISAVNNEAGGAIAVNYTARDCVRGTRMPGSQDQNTMRCFPQYWTPDGQPDPVLDWFHKYLVTSVSEVDRVGGADPVYTEYEYVGGGAWAFNDSETLASNRRTWSQWRGYGTVRTRVGHPDQPRTLSETLFFRGMDGDKLTSGFRDVNITDSEGGITPDNPAYQGSVRESKTYNGTSGPVISKTITDAWIRGATASRARTGLSALQSFIVRSSKTRTFTAKSTGGWIVAEAEPSFDSGGYVTQLDDRGDTAVSGDEECTRFSYVSDASSMLIGLSSRVQKTSDGCNVAASPSNVVSDVRTYYDYTSTFPNNALVYGLATKTERLASWSGSTPVYVIGSRATYDSLGRTTTAFDSLGRDNHGVYACHRWAGHRGNGDKPSRTYR